jgi:two-component system, chemotaxis family, protein-glutamate methylesterase/glutaminase
VDTQNELVIDASGVPDNTLRIVVFASSAGGLHALSAVLAGLPATLPATLAVVQHLDPHHPSLLTSLLSHRTELRVKSAEHGERMTAGVVYIAVPDKHLMINPDHTVALSDAKLMNFLRPAANLLFDSAAVAFKDLTIAVVLTGTGSDGSIGVRAVRKAGGKVIVQDLKSAEYSGMPLAAINTGCVDMIVPLHEIAPTLIHLIMQGNEGRG